MMKKYADGGKHMDAKQDKPMMKKIAKEEVKAHEAKMHGKKMADGGYVGCGKRSMQDYGKKK